MGKLRKEKIESIKKTFARTNSLTETAEIEGVDDRTVSKHVTPKKTDISGEPSVSQRSVDDIGTVKPQSDISFKVYKAFETGSTNIAVCLKFKLSTEHVIRYREDYNTLKKADFDVELERKNILKTAVEAAIQQRKKELSDVEARIEKENARLIELQGLASRGSDGYLEGFLQKMEDVPENQIYEYAHRIVKSDFYARAMAELNVRMVLGAITRHPNPDRIFNELKSRASKHLSSVFDIQAADGDVLILVSDVKKNAVRSGLLWRESGQAKNYYEKQAKQWSSRAK